MLSRLLPLTDGVHHVGPPYELRQVMTQIRRAVWATYDDEVSTVKLVDCREP
jgi:hypothetical protein